MKQIISFQEEKEQILAIIAEIQEERKASHIVPNHVLATEIINRGFHQPQQATYYFTKASIPRALNENELKKQAARYSLRGDTYSSVSQAYESAKAHANAEDFIYIGGSSFVVADLLGYIQR